MQRQADSSVFIYVVAIAWIAVSVMLVGCMLVGSGETTTESTPDAAHGTVGSPGGGQIVPDDDQIAEPPADPRETRAVWSYAGRNATSKRDIDALLAKVDGAHLNVIIVLVYRTGTAYFEPSHARFPDSNERLTNQSAFSEEGAGLPDGDALSYLLAIRDERRSDDDPSNDFEVHAWVNVTENGDWDSDAEKPRPDMTEPYMLHHLHPEFKIKYGAYYGRGDERYVNHRYSVVHQPKFRAYMVDLIAGLVEDYDVDGIHLDYIRTINICYNDEFLDYAGTEYDFPGCQEDYKSFTRQTFGREYTLWQDTDGWGAIRDGGSGRIAAWQERGVGMLVKSIHDEVRSVRPDVIITAAVGMTRPETREESRQGQIAWEWLDRGWIDGAFVMAYPADTQAVVSKVQGFMDATQNESSRLKVFPGLATYTIPDRHDQWSDLVGEQMNAVMRGQWTGQALEPPARGVALFRAEYFSDAAVGILADGPFMEPEPPFWGEWDQ